ncbi:MAG: alkaline phosphatase [Rhodothermales bacterium]
MMPILSSRSTVGALLLLLFFTGCTSQENASSTVDRRPANVILFVADGAGPAHFTMAREMARHMGLRDELYIDPFLIGTVRTHSAVERVTDSASSATAYATGRKTYNGAIAVDTLREPIQTVLEAAEADGIATGLVSTSRITHATPASFAAHVPDRGMEDEIALQMIGQGVDVILGGGARHFLPLSDGGVREDDRNLFDEAENAGYTVVENGAELAAHESGPVLGLFSRDHMPYVIDVASEDHVDLAGLTRKALELLDGHEEGFFLLVEGSRIDHASHDNDGPAALRELIAYDDAFEVARAFAERNGETLVIAVADHETGGLTAGRSVVQEGAAANTPVPGYSRSLYGSAEYAWYPEVLARSSSSTEAAARSILAGQDAGSVLQRDLGIDAPTSEELAAVSAAGSNEGRLKVVLGEIIARRAVIGWTSTGHTAVDVNLYAYGPGSEVLSGNVDNTRIGEVLFEMAGVEVGEAASTP